MRDNGGNLLGIDEAYEDCWPTELVEPAQPNTLLPTCNFCNRPMYVEPGEAYDHRRHCTYADPDNANGPSERDLHASAPAHCDRCGHNLYFRPSARQWFSLSNQNSRCGSPSMAVLHSVAWGRRPDEWTDHGDTAYEDRDIRECPTDGCRGLVDDLGNPDTCPDCGAVTVVAEWLKDPSLL